MKRIFALFSAVAMLFLAVSCHSSTIGTGKQAAGGSPYELVVSIDQSAWQSPVGDTIRAIFEQPVAYVNQNEPLFNVMRIEPSMFKDFLRVHRNVLFINVNPEKPTANKAVRDLNSDGQMMLEVSAPTVEAMAQYLSENRAALVDVFELAERDRSIKQNSRYPERVLVDKVQKMFSMHLDVPRGFTIRGQKGDSLLVLSNEYPVASQGIIIYDYPYTGREDFGKAALLARRNEFVQYIPGPSAGSYMTTSRAFEPDVIYRRIDGRQWAEMRGFWDVEGDFMGGPMVSWTTLNPNTNKVVCIDCYVFSPKYNKRNYLRALEHVIYSASFDTK